MPSVLRFPWTIGSNQPLSTEQKTLKSGRSTYLLDRNGSLCWSWYLRRGERFLYYDVRFQDAQTLPLMWRHQVKLEQNLTARLSDSFPRCIAEIPLHSTRCPVPLSSPIALSC